MSAFKRLNRSDVFTVPYVAHKSWGYTYNSIPSASGDIVLYEGLNEVQQFYPNASSPTTSLGEYKSLIFKEINQLFYQEYTGSLNTQSLMLTTTNYESASAQRNTSSYFNYNENPAFYGYYPTGTNETIQVFSVAQQIYGERIKPSTFFLSEGDESIIQDDGLGNLYRNEEHVGNIFYSHGLAVITNQAYQFIWYPITLTFENEFTTYENYVTCTAKENEFNLTYNPTLLQTITSPSASVQDFATGSVFVPYVTSIGMYNDRNELLAVAKLAQPIPVSKDTDMTFVIRYDT